MTDIPLQADLADIGTTEAQFQQAISSLRKVIVEMPGGGNSQSLTLSGDSVTPAGNEGVFLVVDTEGGAASDNCSTVVPTNCRDGHLIFVSCNSPARVVTLKHLSGGSGQLDLTTNGDVVLDDPDKVICLRYLSGSDKWQEVFRSWSDVVNTFDTDTGAANSYLISPQPPIHSYKQGMSFSFKAANTNSGASTLNVNGKGTRNILKPSNSGPVALQGGEIRAGSIVQVIDDGTQFIAIGGLCLDRIVQQVFLESKAPFSNFGAGNLIPFDNTIPQNTEGVEVFSLAITPKRSDSILLIEVTLWGAHSQGSGVPFIASLFKDSDVDAIATDIGWTQNLTARLNILHRRTSGGTSAQVYKVRIGFGSAGGTNGVFMNSLNGGSGGWGQTVASSVTITELAPWP